MRFALLLLFVAAAASAHAQQILLKNGQKIATQGVTRRGDMVMGKIQVGSNAGEVGYQVGTIARIEFATPPQLASAADKLNQGEAAKALAEITPVVAYYDSFKDLPGAFWAEAALIKVSALAALGRDAEANGIVEQIQKSTSDPDAARAAPLRLLPALLKKEQFERALQISEDAIKVSTRPDVLAEAWLSKGEILLAQKQYDEALLACLHVPVFFENEKLFLPRALLASARAYRGLEDLDRAKKSLNQLTTAFPKSPEATLAKSEMQKLRK